MAKALLVGKAYEMPSGTLLLRLGDHSISRDIDPVTEKPGDLPDSFVKEVMILAGPDSELDRALVVFRDGTEIPVELDAYAEGISP